MLFDICHHCQLCQRMPACECIILVLKISILKYNKAFFLKKWFNIVYLDNINIKRNINNKLVPLFAFINYRSLILKYGGTQCVYSISSHDHGCLKHICIVGHVDIDSPLALWVMLILTHHWHCGSC